MWVFLSDAFFSIVSHDSASLLVRARRKGDIERVFGVDAAETIGRDYQLRAIIDRKTVASVMAGQIEGIAYDNFKNSVRDPKLHSACSTVWGVMAKLQQFPPYHHVRGRK